MIFVHVKNLNVEINIVNAILKVKNVRIANVKIVRIKFFKIKK